MEKGAVACIVSPNAVDAQLAISFLGDHAISATSCSGLHDLAAGLDELIGCAVIVEEALVPDEIPALREALGRLPAWLDLPLVVVARDVAAFGALVAQSFPRSGNVTLLERPLNPHTLASAVTVALRSTARQREMGDLLAEREQAVTLRDEFLAMLAHELRNPLAPMKNALYLMRMLQIEHPTFVKSTAILERQVHHMVRMVDDLMDVARMERGKVVLQKQTVDLNRAVAAAVESTLAAVQDRGHRVNIQLASGPLLVEGDPVRLEQIVCNLLNNAVKFTPQPGEIRVVTSLDNGCAKVAVRDPGIGFSPGVAEKLFDPFLQVNPTLARSTGGLGMGLTIVKRLAELHGGTVRAESGGPGTGSRFEVRFPIAEGAPLEPAKPLTARADGRRRRVVVVEDNADIRETLRLLLGTWGHEVQLAPDGPAGLDLVLRTRPEVALIDVGLPGMNGYEVARAVRRLMSPDAIQLIAVTGYGQPSDRERAFDAGFDSHLLKPIAPQALEEILAR